MKYLSNTNNYDAKNSTHTFKHEMFFYFRKFFKIDPLKNNSLFQKFQMKHKRKPSNKLKK